MEFILANDSEELTKDEFALVTKNEAEALTKLEKSPWIKLSETEAERFLGMPVDRADGQLILLRALSLNERNGAFSVTWHEQAVRVHHGCLGRYPLPMTRRALVARLPELPTEVYVDCIRAE